MFKMFIKSKTVSIISLAAIVLVIAGSLWAYFSLRVISAAPLILHFDDIEGITSVGGFMTIGLVGLFGLVVGIMNFVIALELERRDKFLGKLVAVSTLIFAILLFISFAAIINVN